MKKEKRKTDKRKKMKVGVAGESGDVGGKLKFLFFNFF